ncbi:prefoldin subunit 1 [[Candida] jaroonii]|uniref:Prefoldin subunit 1 n=1 Tax=[Candida] jaroonii TaxID=467808 RepID=A0ACA9Y9T1_9ASCO|nr:prefoldin subunit 1 [[Candida] jaroonii]
MDNQLNKSRAELNMCNLQLERVDTNLRMINQTSNKLNKVCGDNETVWQGIGRTFVQTDVGSYVGEISKDKVEFEDSKKSLLTKKNYIETTLEKTVENMTRLVGKN